MTKEIQHNFTQERMTIWEKAMGWRKRFYDCYQEHET